MKISNKVNSMQFSPIRRFNPFGFKAEADGKKVYHLNIGQPDVETPEVFMNAIRNYGNKVIAYAESGGINDLRDAVCDYFKAYGMNYDRDDIMVTTGGSEALSMTFLTILNEGDEILIAEPFYTNYHTFATAAGGVVVPITTKAEDGYHYAKREQIEACITPKTKAIIPVHIFGTPANMDKINEIAKKNNLYVIEDACQAIGAKYKDKMIGTLSDIACFSFFPTKNLGTYGDGGLITTNNDNLATICRALKAHGSGENGEIAYNLLNNIEEEVKVDSQVDDTVYNPKKYYNYLIGHNSRLDELHAGILNIKLNYLDEWNGKRNSIGYSDIFKVYSYRNYREILSSLL